MLRQLANIAHARRFSTAPLPRATTVVPPPTVATSALLRTSRDDSLWTPGLSWRDDDEVLVGAAHGRPHDRELKEEDLRPVEEGGRETEKMNITLMKDRSALVFGEDELSSTLRGQVFFGGVFRCTMGLADAFGQERVFNTPLTEQGIAGFGIGLAAMGHTAVAEMQFADYIFPAFDQLVNDAKYRYRSGGQFNAGSLTVRSPCSAVGHGGLYHSQSPEAYFLQASGLKVIVPRSPIQAKGLLLRYSGSEPRRKFLESFTEHDEASGQLGSQPHSPQLFLEPKILYRSSVEQVPTCDYELPLSSAEILQEGKDLTIVSYGPPLYTIEGALHHLKHPGADLDRLIPQELRGLSVEVIDLRTIIPYDIETVVKSVNKTGRCLIVHEAPQAGGMGSELAAEIQQRCFLRLEAPVKRLTGWDTPFGLAYEKFYLPDHVRILDGIIETMRY
ncbi:SPOSA6832_01449 [Sporobolomyces salmonicolor]|uniref:3-methyl-2-oxobutanoate dehydrogenase (2-methylpropanoyl-transferring) n=1 Tax=Sporidiobolus salmonicolor TaxID=5005 RepID=A0A0D6EJH3_SPOSA|nr:SPOSA6832_01449 [Sporobolomyces salmonicolor]